MQEDALIAAGAIPVITDKLAEKTVSQGATAAPVRGTSCPVPLKSGRFNPVEIAVHIPVLFPDTADILPGQKGSGGIFKGRNCRYLFFGFRLAMYRIFAKKQILKQILKRYES